MSVDNKTQIAWWVARNHLGEYYCKIDYHMCWSKDLKKARRHDKIGPLKSAITKWVNEHPDQPVPEILEWVVDISSARIIDVSSETKKRMNQAKTRAVRKEIRHVESELESIKQKQEALKTREQELLNR